MSCDFCSFYYTTAIFQENQAELEKNSFAGIKTLLLHTVSTSFPVYIDIWFTVSTFPEGFQMYFANLSLNPSLNLGTLKQRLGP